MGDRGEECLEGNNMILRGDTRRYRSPTRWDTIGDFRSHSKEVVAHAGMYDFHRRLVAGVAVTATHASFILTVNRDKNREISPAVSSKYSKYRSDRMAAQIVADITSK